MKAVVEFPVPDFLFISTALNIFPLFLLKTLFEASAIVPQA